MKKLISLVLTLALVLSLAVPALAAEPTVTGEKEKNVKATFAPEISLSGISITGDTVTYDPDTNTYIAVFPVGAESITCYTVYSGKNLAYYRDALDRIWFRDTLFVNGEQFGPWDSVLSEYNFFTYDDTTGNLTTTGQPGAASAGQTWVLSYSNDGGNTWQEACTQVFVQAYSITNSTAADANGTVTAPASAIEGETVTLTVTPNEGYGLDALTVTYVDAEGVTQNVAVADNAFVMPAAAVTVTATFKEATETYTVTLGDTVNGTVAADKTTGITAGETVTLTVTPENGYKLTDLTVMQGETEVTVTDNTFVMPESDVTVTAIFEKVYTIKPVSVGEGAVSADKTSAAEGETVTVTFTPDAGHVLFQQDAYDPVNTSTYVELTPGTDVNTFTFVMPAHAVQVVGGFTKDGKACEDLYFNNGGNNDWTNVSVSFYNDSGFAIGSVTLTLAENGIYTLPEGAEIPNLTYKVDFFNNVDSTVIADIPTDKNNMFTLGTTTDEYGYYEGTWSVYTPSTPEDVTSADIAWGSLAYTYSDETGEWTTDGSAAAGTVTVKNTGTTTVTVNVSYSQETGYEEITGAFDNGGALLESKKSMTYTLTLSGQPKKALNGQKIGTVTVKIDSAAGAE